MQGWTTILRHGVKRKKKTKKGWTTILRHGVTRRRKRLRAYRETV